MDKSLASDHEKLGRRNTYLSLLGLVIGVAAVVITIVTLIRDEPTTGVFVDVEISPSGTEVLMLSWNDSLQQSSVWMSQDSGNTWSTHSLPPIKRDSLRTHRMNDLAVHWPSRTVIAVGDSARTDRCSMDSWTWESDSLANKTASLDARTTQIHTASLFQEQSKDPKSNEPIDYKQQYDQQSYEKPKQQVKKPEKKRVSPKIDTTTKTNNSSTSEQDQPSDPGGGSSSYGPNNFLQAFVYDEKTIVAVADNRMADISYDIGKTWLGNDALAKWIVDSNVHCANKSNRSGETPFVFRSSDSALHVSVYYESRLRSFTGTSSPISNTKSEARARAISVSAQRDILVVTENDTASEVHVLRNLSSTWSLQKLYVDGRNVLIRACAMDWKRGDGYLVGAGGIVLRTRDGARTWTPLALVVNDGLDTRIGVNVVVLITGFSIGFILMSNVGKRKAKRREIDLQERAEKVDTTRMYGDNPSSTDTLGFSKSSKAILDLMDNPESQPPINIVVNGVWGSGKSSLMSQVKVKLDEEPKNICVWFNAWHYQSEQHILNAFASQLATALDTELSGKLKWRFRLRLFAQRIGSQGFFKQTMLILMSLLLLACFSFVLLHCYPFYESVGLWVLPEVKRWLGFPVGHVTPKGSFGIMHLIDDLFYVSGLNSDGGSSKKGLIELIATLIVGGGGLALNWGNMFQTFFKALNLKALKSNTKKDSDQQRIGVRESFRHEFINILEALPPGTKLVIFIDDVDRIVGEKIMEVLEAVNFLTDSVNRPSDSRAHPASVFFVIGMSLKEVTDVINRQLKSTDMQLKDTGDKERDDEDGRTLGARYIEKLIDVLVNMPEPSDSISSLTGSSNQKAHSAATVNTSTTTTDDVWYRKYLKSIKTNIKLARSLVRFALPGLLAMYIIFQFQGHHKQPAHRADSQQPPKSQASSQQNSPAVSNAVTIAPTVAIREQQRIIEKEVMQRHDAAMWSNVLATTPYLAYAASLRSAMDPNGVFVLLSIAIFISGYVYWRGDVPNNFFYNSINEKSKDPSHLDAEFTTNQKHIRDYLKTPRRIKRFGNRIRIQYSILSAQSPTENLPQEPQWTKLYFQLALLVEAHRTWLHENLEDFQTKVSGQLAKQEVAEHFEQLKALVSQQSDQFDALIKQFYNENKGIEV